MFRQAKYTVLNKLTLKYEPDLDFILIAITAPLKDYRLCFKINRQLAYDFKRIDELALLFNSGQRTLSFNRYSYRPADTGTEFYLLANKGDEGFLIPEMKKADYFMLIRNYIDEEDVEQIVTGLNRIPDVLVAAEVDPKRLKSKENLVF